MHHLPELDDAIQDLSEVLGQRLVILDAFMRVVGYSIHELAEDRERLSHILAHSDSWPSPRTTKDTHSVEDVPGVGRVLFVRLLGPDQHTVGHLIVRVSVANGAVEIARAVAEIDAHKLGALLAARQRVADEQAERSRRHTVDLVSDNVPQREAAATALLSENILSTARLYCAVAVGVDPRGAGQQDLEKASLAVSLTVRFVNASSTATVVGGTLDDRVGVLIFPRPVVASRLIRILEGPQLTRVRAGIGPLTELSQVYRSFERARLAWRASWLAPDQHPVALNWNDAGLDGTLARLPVEEFTMEDLPAATRDVLDSPKSRGLVPTLEAYLASGGDAQRAAHSLNIHRSTLYYRLDKLRGVIPGDLRDGVLRRELHTGLRIARLAGISLGED